MEGHPGMRSHDLWNRWFSESRADYEAGIAEKTATFVAKHPEKYSAEAAEELFRRFIYLTPRPAHSSCGHARYGCASQIQPARQ